MVLLVLVLTTCHLNCVVSEVLLKAWCCVRLNPIKYLPLPYFFFFPLDKPVTEWPQKLDCIPFEIWERLGSALQISIAVLKHADR